MAIPDRPLELDVDTRKFTLGEMAVFDTDEMSANPLGWMNKVRKFLIAHSVSWTADEINAITTDELEAITPQIGNALQRTAVPLANSPRSKTTRGERVSRSRPGPTNSSSLKSSTSHPEKSEAG